MFKSVEIAQWRVNNAGRGEELHETEHSVAWAYWKWQDILAQKSCSHLEHSEVADEFVDVGFRPGLFGWGGSI